MKLHLRFLFLVLFIYAVILITIPTAIWAMTSFPYLPVLLNVLAILLTPFMFTIAIWLGVAASKSQDLNS